MIGDIANAHGKVFAAFKSPAENRRECAEAVRVTAASLSAFLGYAPPKPTHTAQGDVAAVSLMP